MTAEILPTTGRVVLAKALVALPFLFAVSRGNPAWDAQWGDDNPPTPPLSATGVFDLIGYARPTIVGFLVPDDAGSIVGSGGARYSNSNVPTRYLRVRLSLPVGSYAGQTLREIGLFANPAIDPSVPSGQTLIDPADVVSPGDLFQLHWREPLPLEEGDFFARNFVVRL